MRLRATLVASALSLLAALLPAAAIASWKGASSGSGTSEARSMGSVDQPTASNVNRNVTVNWAVPGAGAPVTGYLVRRYDESGNAQTIGAGCSGTIATTSCTESAVPPGRWRYRVTAVNAKWRGPESAASALVSVLVSQTLTTSAWDLRDSSAGGSAVNVSDPIAFASDGRTVATSTPPTSFSTSRYLEIDANGPLPTNASPTSADIQHALRRRRRLEHGLLLLRPSAGVDQRRARHPRQRRQPGRMRHRDRADDLLDGAAGAFPRPRSQTICALASMSGDREGRLRSSIRQRSRSSVSQGAFALYDEVFTDRLGGGATTDTWPLVASGDPTYVSASTWPTAFSSSSYLQLTFPAYVPGGATVSGGSFLHRFRRSGGGGSACWYLQVLQGTTVIGTHGSATSPISCTSGNSYRNDTVSLPEINSPALANGVVLRVYVRSSTGRSTEHDQANLTINYAN